MKFTAYQAYLKMPWTGPNDECEAACGTTMTEGRYSEGRYGHYCSEKCKSGEDAGPYEDPDYERKQMGITS